MTILPDGEPGSNSRRGVWSAVGSVLAFAVMTLCVRSLPSTISTGEALVCRGLTGILVLVPALSARSPAWKPVRSAWAVLLLRAVAGALSMAAFFWTVRHAGMGLGRALADTNPVFVIVLAALIGQERLTPLRVGSALLSLGGVALIADGGAGQLSASVLLVGLAGALAAAVAFVSLRHAAQHMDARVIVVAVSVSMLLLGLFEVSPSNWPQFGWRDFGLLFGVGVFGTAGQLLLTRAYLFSPASVVSILLLLLLPVLMLVEVVLQATVPPPRVLGGVALIFVAAWIAAWRPAAQSRSAGGAFTPPST